MTFWIKLDFWQSVRSYICTDFFLSFNFYVFEIAESKMAPTSKRTASDKVEILESKVSKKDAIEEEAPEVTLFREYLRIKSVQPDPDYDSCLVFLRKQAERLGLEHHTTEMVKGEDTREDILRKNI